MKKALSQLEQWTMDVIWASEQSTAEQIRIRLARKRVLKDSTIRTILRRLESKEYVKHTVEGRTYLYSGVDRPVRVAAQAVRQLIDRFCNGSVENLLVGMVDQEVIAPEELKRIAALIDQQRKKE
jgi:BlaI family transcriptional regulator, penicillinase repressor